MSHDSLDYIYRYCVFFWKGDVCFDVGYCPTQHTFMHGFVLEFLEVYNGAFFSIKRSGECRRGRGDMRHGM